MKYWEYCFETICKTRISGGNAHPWICPCNTLWSFNCEEVTKSVKATPGGRGRQM